MSATITFDEWTQRFDCTATSQGWSLFDAEGKFDIEGIDAPEDGRPGLNDLDALELVARQAAGGCRMSLLALFLDGKPIWEKRLSDGINKIRTHDIPKFLDE